MQAPDSDLEQVRAELVRAARLAEAEYRAALAIASSLDLDQVLDALLSCLATLVPYDSGCVMLREGDALVIRAVRGYPHPDQVRGVSFDAARTPHLAPIVFEGRAVVVPDTRACTSWKADAGAGRAVVSWIGVPLVVQGEVLGVYSLDRGVSDGFSNEHVALAERIAAPAAIAIRHARTHADLHRAKETIEQGAWAKDVFLRTMSHELRTPLTGVIGVAEALREELADLHPDDVRASLDGIVGTARHLADLLGLVLDLADLESGHALAAAPFRVDDLLAEVAAAVAPGAVRRGLAIEVSAASDLASVCTDRHRLRQVLIQLLDNAIKFTDEGRIALAARRDGGLRIEVSDTGPGLAPEVRARLFEAFAPGDASSTRLRGGAGLGLALAHRVALALGGRIEVESTPGRGSTFAVVVPADR